MSQLDFDTLRKANEARLPLFKNKHGNLAHSKSDGSDWSPAQWLQAVVGELGEYANFRKKYERGDITKEEFSVEAEKELADVIIYLDLLAKQLGIDLGQAVTDKFNEVSRRVGVDVWLAQQLFIDGPLSIGLREGPADELQAALDRMVKVVTTAVELRREKENADPTALGEQDRSDSGEWAVATDDTARFQGRLPARSR